MAKGAGKARKKLPKELAVVLADNCTGCEACIEVCPVDCIYKVPGQELPGVQSFVDIDLERCIGCELCAKWCPWDAIDMVPTPQTGSVWSVPRRRCKTWRLSSRWQRRSDKARIEDRESRIEE